MFVTSVVVSGEVQGTKMVCKMCISIYYFFTISLLFLNIYYFLPFLVFLVSPV